MRGGEGGLGRRRRHRCWKAAAERGQRRREGVIDPKKPPFFLFFPSDSEIIKRSPLRSLERKKKELQLLHIYTAVSHANTMITFTHILVYFVLPVGRSSGISSSPTFLQTISLRVHLHLDGQASASSCLEATPAADPATSARAWWQDAARRSSSRTVFFAIF